MPDQNLANTVATLKGVFILGGDVTPADNPNYLGLGWRSLRGTEPDKTGPMPSYWRVLAGAALYRMNPDITLVPSGGKSNLPGQTGQCPATSAVMSAELQELGVPASSIVEEDQAFTTGEHFVYGPPIARAHGWKPEEIGIVSNFFHLSRAAALLFMGDADDYAPFALGKAALLSAERILEADSSSWRKICADFYKRPDVQVTLASEAAGVGQILTGHSPLYLNLYPGCRDPLA